MTKEYQLSEYSEDALPSSIDPEGAKVANTYLANACSILATSSALEIPTHEISATLQSPLVKTYINGVLRENGYRHMVKIAEKLDSLVELKWAELEEAEIGSNKDIADLLSLAHKMQHDMAKLIQADAPKEVGTQNNTQVNVYGEGAYGKLMEKLIDA